MHNTFYVLTIILLFSSCKFDKNKQVKIDEHSAEYALDYEGTYKGTYPCADCSGIEIALTLNKDETFVYQTVYLDKKDGSFVHKGNYTVKESKLTIQEDDKPVNFLIGESAVTLLGDNLRPNTDELADFYILKKQGKFNYQGKYETFNDEKGSYTQTLSIQEKEKSNYEIIFSASKVKNRENCRFSNIGYVKNDTLWVNISNEKDKEVLMYIAPSHDNLGVEVFTPNFEDRFYMMRYCGGGGSLAGKYLKNTVTASSIGGFNKQNTIMEVLQILPNVQIQKKIGKGEFAEDVYDDYEIYNHNNQLLFSLTPKNTGDVHQKINRVLINSPFFKTEKGINTNSTYGDIKNAYTVNKIEPTREHIFLIVDELNASFSISKNKLKKDWWNDKTKTVNENKILLNTQIDNIVLWWNE
ncbi:copper resistance protein NlpE N-terminal domain-containing protein [Tenacibaculum finnmarkense genomovar finnmarkense]|uniref:copper resistance protein NlpE n=1 Tax=Tenacibaculum finnmarkense TaxID=2781243 RepID=UPI001EFA8035|nr:copper resistance protein NlpE [Tenacibaculum finnmarkense]MCG8220938.1 copper resistance protein NlpE N-terminal domain-containing protein [Tenacibaculum finnmarkense genomovar finnmarkense]MCG8223669.1 copper resistance protein NlpE N-terminal domain-containing protein [Tenacibaculum finnmarkense genomovar finnmarkense]MCG8229134.1 copper resistance protein NlpE N-terminal domain-containing protein [Tenacibaculum finnmarkense genomovar finnmarkense]